MGQEEEKGVTGGEDGTLGLGRMPGALKGFMHFSCLVIQY